MQIRAGEGKILNLWSPETGCILEVRCSTSREISLAAMSLTGTKAVTQRDPYRLSGRDLEAPIYFLPQFPPNSLLFCSQSSKLSPLHIHLDLDADRAIDLLSRRLLHLWGLGD